MAKAKKQEKSIEQRLEEALVLYEKTPYKLPSNWCWVKLEDLTNITAGGTPARNNHRYWDNGQIPWVKISDLSGKYVETTEERITQLGLDNSSAKIFKKGTILYTIFATIGEVSILNIDAATNQAIAGITCKEPYNLDYMYYVLLVLKDLLVSKAKGVAQVNINQSILKETPIPLAPIEEQKRIVEIIEKQFAKLDEARNLIQISLDSFADRKSAILYKAFIGELTKKWRDIHGKGFNWREKKLNEVCSLITDGTHQTPTYTDESGYIFLSSKNVRTGVIDWDNIKYIPESLHNELYSRLAPRKDDILLAKNGTTGIAAIVDRDCVFDIYVSLALIRPKVIEVLPRFLLYAISTPEVKQYFDSSLKGIGVPNLHLKYIKETIIPIPSLDEQEEIVRILDSIFEKEDKSKELIDMLDKIDEMKKSILARAFRGQLGTFNPTDEPATDLLRKILGKKEE